MNYPAADALMSIFGLVRVEGEMEGFTLPDGTVTTDAAKAAELWAAAFYRAKDAIRQIRPIPGLILNNKPTRNLDEALGECDAILGMGE